MLQFIDMEESEEVSSRYTRMKNFVRVYRKTLSFIGFLFVLGIAATAVLLLEEDKPEIKSEAMREVGDLCLTQLCTETAGMIVKSMNPKVDPCEDFYEYVCGQYSQKHEGIEKEKMIGTYQIYQRRIKLQLLDTLRDAAVRVKSHQKVSPIERLVGVAFLSCVNTSGNIDIQSLKATYSAMGGWPVLEGKEWKEQNFNWINGLAFGLNSVGSTALIAIEIGKNPYNETRFIISIKPSEVPYAVSAYTSKLFILNLAKLMGNHDLKQILEDIKSIESVDAFIYDLYDHHDDTSAMEVKISQLQKDIPEMDWISFLRTVLQYTGHKISPSDSVVVSNMPFIKAVVTAIHGGKLNPRAVANFIGWSMTCVLKALFREVSTRCYSEEEISAEQQFVLRKNQIEDCIGILSTNLNYAVENLLYTRYGSLQSEEPRIRAMIKSLWDSFHKIVMEADWLDPETKKKTRIKLKNTIVHIGYPKWILNSSVVEHFYQNLTMGHSFVDNYIKMKRFMNIKIYSQLDTNVNRAQWPIFGESTVLNAFNILNFNAVVLERGFLNFPFFSTKLPWFINYARSASIIAHEFTHSLGGIGIKRDHVGNIKYWFSAQARKEYKKRYTCFVEQYNREARKMVNDSNFGDRTVEENIADCGGIRQSFRAYKKWLDQHGTDRRLPGLETFSHEEMFFISYAWLECITRPSQAMMATIMKRAHPSSQFRVNVPLSNLDGFAEAFNCPKGSRMNPVDKCVMW